MYTRGKGPDGSSTPAVQVKRDHFTAGAAFYDRTPLMAFVDDDSAAVQQLRAAGVPAHTLTELSAATDEQLLSLAAADAV